MLNQLVEDKYNAILLDNVSSKDKINPNPKEIYNLVVVGAGSAGLITAIIASSLGAKVALVERHLMGGDCLNVGCVPSKALISSSKMVKKMRKASVFGLGNHAVNAKKAFPNIMTELRRIRAEISENDSQKRYASFGIDVFFGDAKFSMNGKNNQECVEVDNKILNFDKAVIASGARAVEIPIEGLSREDYYTNENIFELTEQPEHILFLGGGPIGCELAQAFARLGSKVSIVQRGLFLPREDPDASKLLAEVFEKDGIDVLLDANILKVEKLENGRKKAFVEDNNKNILEIEIDVLFVGIGRAPNVENMGLESVSVEFDKRNGVKVDDTLRTSNPNIFAAGDCCMLWKFTHAADAAAQIVVQNALFHTKKKLSKLIMPWCTYTEPEIAHVGMYEYDAKENGIEVDFYRFDMKEIDRALADREELGFVKIMTQKNKDKILGATIVSAHAGEMISEITTAMQAGMGLSKLASVIHPYPTQASAIQRAAQQYKKTKFTPFVAKIFKKLLAFQLNRAIKRRNKTSS